MTVRELLQQKGRQVYTVDHEASCLDAARKMVEVNVGSLLVVDERERPLGIVTERDILRKLNVRGLPLDRTLVRDVMTRDVIVVTPDDDLDTVMQTMTTHRIRHVPVVEENRLAGLISIGDVVKAMLRNVEVQTRHLLDYIQDRYPG
ncbi:MAG: CBS domain-containing protein [Calditrichaeota bacterium]|nr:CBS domain-containing protein [Calditrichota bacterium]